MGSGCQQQMSILVRHYMAHDNAACRLDFHFRVLVHQLFGDHFHVFRENGDHSAADFGSWTKGLASDELSCCVDCLLGPPEDLEKFDARKAKVVELRFFGGLNLDETAQVLQVSRDTVKRDWKLAKTWLLCEMAEGGGDGSRALAQD
jgi:hypothetical protein